MGDPVTVEQALGPDAAGESTRSVLRRALSIIDALDENDRSVTLTELARRTDLPKATVFRLVNELVRWGALERSGHTYTLGARLFMLGEMVPLNSQLRELAMPYLSELYEVTHENTSLGVMHGTDVLFLVRLSGHRSSDMKLRIGKALPAHATATGKALLAHAEPELVRQVVDAGLRRMAPRTIVMPGVLARQLRSIAARGYAVNYEEMRPGRVAAAAPVIDADGAPVAAVSVAGRSDRINMTQLIPALVETARSLSRAVQEHAHDVGEAAGA